MPMVTKHIRLLSLILLFSVIFGYLTTELEDFDFWWHLKQGEWIVKNRALLSWDPFSFTSTSPPDILSLRERFILTQYWLSDVTFYSIWLFSGIKGIIIFRACIYILIVFIVFILLLYRGVRFHLSYGLVILLGFVTIFYRGERPQFFSFLFASILFSLLEIYRSRNSELESPNSKLQTRRLKPASTRYMLYAIPFLMLLWSNFHGGFIYGDAILLLYLFSELSKYLIKGFWGREWGTILSKKDLSLLTLIIIISIGTSFINPNTYRVIPLLIELKESIYEVTITEYFSLIKFSKYVSPIPLLIFITFTLPTSLLMLKKKKIDLTDLFFFITLGSIAFYSMRYLIFYSIFTTPLLGRYLNDFWDELSGRIKLFKRNLLGFFNKIPLIEVSLIILCTLLFIKNTREGVFFRFWIKKGHFPEGPVRFLKENNLNKNMFNHLLWGGYIIYNLYPEYQVFLDGRTFKESTYLDHEMIMLASQKKKGGLPEWKYLLNLYGINFILVFPNEPYTGRLYPLIPALIGDKDWHLIFLDDNSLIFLRDKEEDQELINRLGMPNEWAYNTVIVSSAIAIRSMPKNPQHYITMGDAFFAKRNYRNAKDVYLKGKEIAPDNKIILERLEVLNAYGY